MASSGVRKAAVLLTSLPQEEAAQVLGRLEQRHMEIVSIEIARLGTVSAEEQDAVQKQFIEASPTSAGGAGGLEVAKSLVERALGKNASGMLETMRQQIEALPFSFLQKVDTQNLMTFVMDEHPQTIALILSHIAPAQASQVIAGLPPEKQLAVVRRVAKMGETNPEMIAEVEKGLEHRMASVMSQQFEKAGGVESVAEILNVTDRSTERVLLDNLSQEDAELVEEIRRLMFVFDDILSFSNKDIQTVLKAVDNSQWAVALKGAKEELKAKILGNMSTRAGDLLREEMEYLGPVRLSAVEQMQQQIVDAIRRLEDSGELVLNAGEEKEEFIQ